MDSDSAKEVASLPAPGRADDVAFDKTSGSLYVPGGEGYISVYEQRTPDRYDVIAKVPSAPGAKTALLVPEIQKLFVAVSPGESQAEAKVLTFQVVPRVRRRAQSSGTSGEAGR